MKNEIERQKNNNEVFTFKTKNTLIEAYNHQNFIEKIRDELTGRQFELIKSII